MAIPCPPMRPHSFGSARLAVIIGWVTLTVLSSPVAGQAAPPPPPAATQPARLTFVATPTGEFTFNTGVVRGKLRARGKSLGLSSLVHIPTGIMLDQGDGGYGLFSHYRVFTANRRYGVGAWDWPSTARLRDDGAVEVHWTPAPDRPFDLKAVYRWVSPDMLDLETIVHPLTDLPGFESFLASYFQPQFTNSLAYVSTRPSPSEAPAFVAAEPALGVWQMFPRDRAVVALIQDGRWNLEPNPVNWVIMPTLARPIGVRRHPASGLSAVLMAPAEDCFAIATPYQTEGHYSLYLSLFGRNLKAGEPARARTRLWITTAFSEPQIVEIHKTFSAAKPNP